MRLHLQAAPSLASVFLSALLSRRGLVIALLALLAWAVVFLPFAAFAQDGAPGTVNGGNALLQGVVAALLPALGIILTGIATWAAAELHRRTGITIEAKHREALQSALMNGIFFALQKSGWVAGQAISPTILSTARDYVETSVPDALAKFGIDAATDAGKEALDRLLTPKIPVAIGTVMPNGDKLIGRLP